MTYVMIIPIDIDSNQLNYTEKSSVCDDEIQSDVGGSVSEHVHDLTCEHLWTRAVSLITHTLAFFSAVQMCSEDLLSYPV